MEIGPSSSGSLPSDHFTRWLVYFVHKEKKKRCYGPQVYVLDLSH